MDKTPAKKDNFKKNITIGATLGYVAFFLNMLSGLFFTPWLILSFGSSEYGIYTLATALINLFLIDFGLSNATTAFVSKHRVNNDQKSIEKTLAIIYKTYFIIDAIMVVVFTSLYFLSPFIYKGLTANELSTFKICLLIVSAFSLISLPTTPFNGILSAYERFAILKLADIIQRVLYIALSALAIFLKLNIYYVVIAQTMSGAVVIVFKHIYIRVVLKVKADFKEKSTKEFVKLILLYSLTASFISICSRISFHFVPNIIGIFSVTKEVTFFGMAATIEGFIYSFGAVISGFFLPKIARISKEKDSTEKVAQLSIKVGRFQFLILSLIILGFFVIGKDFIKIWMHGDTSYEPVYYCIIVLGLYQLFDAPQSVLKNSVYLDSNKIKYHALYEAIGAVLNIVLSFVFCYLFVKAGLHSSLGASLSILLSRSATFALKNLTYKKITGVNMLFFWKKVYLKGTFICLTIFIILNRISEIMQTENYMIRFLILGFTTVILFIFSTLCFNLTQDEKRLLKKTLSRKL